MRINPSSERFFESKYLTSADPWSFTTSRYEIGRYRSTIRALSERRYHRAFEPGCSIGALTRRLATLCDEVIAIDISPTAAKIAQHHCHSLPHVRIRQGSLPDAVPFGPLDLVVLSEIGYYFSTEELDQILWNLRDELAPGAVLLAVHWLGVSPDHVLSGDRVHDQIHALPGMVRTLSRRYEQSAMERFRLDRWELVA